MSDYSNAIEAVAEFYNIDRKTAILYYWDEVEAFMKLITWRNTGE
jgi:hypothetical protein